MYKTAADFRRLCIMPSGIWNIDEHGNSGWGIKNIFKASNTYSREDQIIDIYLYFKHQNKNIPLEIPCFLWPLQQIGNKTTKPSISVVFASFWKWSLSPVRFLQDIGPGNRAFARFVQLCEHLGLDAAVSTAPVTLWSSILSFSMVALKLRWFKVCLWFV